MAIVEKRSHSQAQATYVRKDIWSITSEGDPWHPIVLAYAKAVRTMQIRPMSDPTSWWYQAALHGSYRTPVQRGWNSCQHGGWYFLPWHRMYVYWFESIVRAAVHADGGPEDFAIPYWNYDQPSPRNTLPPAFRQPTLPDGSPNPLHLPAPRRDPRIVAGFGLPPEITSSRAAMATRTFTSVNPRMTTFGGGITVANQFNRSTGQLESQPHNVVHTAIGGPSSGQCAGGLMSDVMCAAQDPIFWLHHANIDRLWSAWLALGDGRDDPWQDDWRDQVFTLFDASGRPAALPCGDVESSIRMGYRYDDEDARRPEVAMASSDRPGAATGGGGEDRPARLAAATEEAVVLSGNPLSVQLTAATSTLELVSAEAVATGGSMVILSVEDLEADRNPGVVYGVYVEAPGTGGGEATRHHVGNVSLFGIEGMNDPDGDHDGVPGLVHNFDITDLAGQLGRAGRWQGDGLTVTFAPIEPEPPAGGPEVALVTGQGAPVMPVRIGRVSLFVA